MEGEFHTIAPIIDDFQETEDEEEPPPKRRGGGAKEWIKKDIFPGGAEANDYVNRVPTDFL